MSAFVPKDPNYETRVRAVIELQAAMQTIGASVESVAPGNSCCSMKLNPTRVACIWSREAKRRTSALTIVNLREELPAFYRRLGYVERGVSPFTPGVQTKAPCHFIHMTKELT